MKNYVLLIVFLVSTISCKKEKVLNSFSQDKTTENKINFYHYLFNTTNNTEEKITLEKGTTYVLDFWYLECPPCVKDHKLVKENISSLEDKNIKVIGISIDRSSENWKNYLLKHNYTWKNYNQYGGIANLKDDLKIKIFPTYIIINDKGKIQEKNNSFELVLNYFKYN